MIAWIVAALLLQLPPDRGPNTPMVPMPPLQAKTNADAGITRTIEKGDHSNVDDARQVLKELALLNATHDVFVVMIDSAFAFRLPDVSAGWVEIADVETGESRTISRRAYRQMASRAAAWQEELRAAAKEVDVDVVTIGLEQTQSDVALSEFVVERRLRKTKT